MIKLVGLAALILFAAMAATNPHEDGHARAMVERAEQSCTGGGEIGSALCGGAASLATMGIHYEDHLIYSTARLGGVETFGMLGQVFIINKD